MSCDEHSCTRTAPGGYCLPPRCYCGGCPWYASRDQIPTYTPDTYTAFDRAAILSSTGRRASLAQYRAAQKERRGAGAGSLRPTVPSRRVAQAAAVRCRHGSHRAWCALSPRGRRVAVAGSRRVRSRCRVWVGAGVRGRAP